MRQVPSPFPHTVPSTRKRAATTLPSPRHMVQNRQSIGQKRKLQTILDNSATELATMYVSGGVRGMQIGLSPRDLIEITDAISGPIARFP